VASGPLGGALGPIRCAVGRHRPDGPGPGSFHCREGIYARKAGHPHQLPLMGLERLATITIPFYEPADFFTDDDMLSAIY
jgi:hypothetical protein